jgi:hypothetical protein
MVIEHLALPAEDNRLTEREEGETRERGGGEILFPSIETVVACRPLAAPAIWCTRAGAARLPAHICLARTLTATSGK